MQPRPFGLASAYLLFAVIAVIVGVAAVIPAARRVRLPLWRLFLAEAIFAGAGLTGALLYNLVESGALHQFGWRAYSASGMRYPGGVLGIILLLPVVRLVLPRHLSLAAFLDLVTIGAAFAMASNRGGCFLMGCCYGNRSSLPWALSYSPTSQVARHHALQGWIEAGSWSLPVQPLHIYFAVASFSVGVFLAWYHRRKSFSGEVALLYLVLHEGSKGLLEFGRGSLVSHSVVHLRVAGLSLAATGLLLWTARRNGMLKGLFPALLRHSME